ncbi:MAG: succinylglutamate desuccinylase/aspartoacylase family protein [Myxococcaceae bacterium]|nr:succinylglutamate desuccinylase/aspartoacylase family protein [Myxococcaceae bacterium]
MDYAALVARLRSHAKVARITRYGTIAEKGRSWPLLRLDTPGSPRLLITAGFHGDEQAGPLTLAQHFGTIARYARARKVGLTVFPCLNPSGFELSTRYNASGEKPNNDFLRYELEDGSEEGVLYGKDPAFRRWRLFKQGPQETRAIRRALERVRTPVAALDLHQDNYMRRAATYAYVFGDAQLYLPLALRSKKHLPLAARVQVDPRLVTDSNGFIWFHDGSVTDWFWRRGVRYAAALETTTLGAPKKCDAVNLIWIRGFIDLVALARL